MVKLWVSGYFYPGLYFDAPVSPRMFGHQRCLTKSECGEDELQRLGAHKYFPENIIYSLVVSSGEFRNRASGGHVIGVFIRIAPESAPFYRSRIRSKAMNLFFRCSSFQCEYQILPVNTWKRRETYNCSILHYHTCVVHRCHPLFHQPILLLVPYNDSHSSCIAADLLLFDRR